MSRPPDTLQGEFARRPAGRPVERRAGEVLLRLPVAPHVRGRPGETAEEATGAREADRVVAAGAQQDRAARAGRRVLALGGAAVIAQALCPTCGRMPRMVQDRGGVWVLDRHHWRRGVPCPGAGLTWREIERQAIATGPARIPTVLLGGAA